MWAMCFEFVVAIIRCPMDSRILEARVGAKRLRVTVCAWWQLICHLTCPAALLRWLEAPSLRLASQFSPRGASKNERPGAPAVTPLQFAQPVALSRVGR